MGLLWVELLRIKGLQRKEDMVQGQCLMLQEGATTRVARTAQRTLIYSLIWRGALYSV